MFEADFLSFINIQNAVCVNMLGLSVVLLLYDDDKCMRDEVGVQAP
jgi:hypothetical protein